MRNWLNNLSYKMQNFMQGRYGKDELTTVINIAAVVLLLAGLFSPVKLFIYLAFAALVWSLYRSYSKNHANRVKELNFYLKIKNWIVSHVHLVKNMWRDRNSYLYIKCPNCKTYIRISRSAKGKHIRINCPKCRNSFEKNA